MMMLLIVGSSQKMYLEGTVTPESLWHWFTETKPKRQKKKRERISMAKAKRLDTLHKRVNLFPLWEVVDERGSVLGSLSIQSGGKARLILGAKQLEDKLHGV